MKHVLKNTLWLLVVFALVVVVNYWADPANLTQNEFFFGRMLSLMQEGYNIEHVADFKDRIFQQKAAEVIDRPETLIFGSSRVQQIDTEVCGTTVWNAGVSGATTQDICGLYQVFRENGKIGDRVIIGIDLWTFDGTYTDARASLYLEAPLARFMSEAVGIPTPAKRFSFSTLSYLSELTSLSYFQSSFDYLMDGNHSVRMRDLVTSTEKDYSLYGMMRFDGSYVYPSNYVLSNQNEVEKRVFSAFDAVVAPTAEWKGIDPQLRTMFEALCGSVVSNGSDLVLLISPIHPIAFYEIKQRGGEAALLDVENYLHEYADSVGATVLGSFDPEACACDFFDFMDALHINYQATLRLWQHDLALPS